MHNFYQIEWSSSQTAYNTCKLKKRKQRGGLGLQ